MLKEASYREKFKTLQPWMPTILQTIKKDLKGDHLKMDRLFYKKYFAGKQLNKLTTDELATAYFQEISEGKEDLGEFVSNRWLLKNTDVYDHFASYLEKINPQFDQITEIDVSFAEEMITKATTQFGAVRAYLFAVFNSVSFSTEQMQKLANDAETEVVTAQQEAEEEETERTLDSLTKKYEREISRLTNKYEKKLIGMEKKYHRDTEALKKQIGTLQKKMDGNQS